MRDPAGLEARQGRLSEEAGRPCRLGRRGCGWVTGGKRFQLADRYGTDVAMTRGSRTDSIDLGLFQPPHKLLVHLVLPEHGLGGATVALRRAGRVGRVDLHRGLAGGVRGATPERTRGFARRLERGAAHRGVRKAESRPCWWVRLHALVLDVGGGFL